MTRKLIRGLYPCPGRAFALLRPERGRGSEIDRDGGECRNATQE